MKKKILLCIAEYEGYKNEFFNRYTSIRNREFAEHQGYEYIEIRKILNFRNSPVWQKLFHIKKFLDDGTLKIGDTITVIDADMAIVDGRLNYHQITHLHMPYALAIHTASVITP